MKKDSMVYIPEDIEGIPVKSIKGAFTNSEIKVKAVHLGKNLKEIKEAAFANNKNLEVFVAEGLETIEKDAFNGDENLKVIVLNEGIKYIGDLAFGPVGSKEIKLPSTLEKIGEIGPFGQNVEGFKVIISKKTPVLEKNKKYYRSSKTSIRDYWLIKRIVLSDTTIKSYVVLNTILIF